MQTSTNHRMSTKSWALVALAVLVAPVSAGSQVFSSAGPGGAIPDDANQGGVFDPAWNSVPGWDALVSSVTVPYPIDRVTSIVINGLQHTRRGDLHVYLENPAGQRFNVVVRPGALPGGLTAFGDSGDMAGNFTLVESSGATLAQGDANLATGTYDQYLNRGAGMYTNPAYPIANVPLESISGGAGTWKLHIRDWAHTQAGLIANWQLVGESEAATPFCFGDGSEAACPCNNLGIAGHGCANSLAPGGALLSGYGYPTVSGDSIVLEARDLSGSVCLFLQGSFQSPASPIDDGLSCLSGSLIRLATKPVVEMVATYPQAGDASVSTAGMITGFGTSTRYYQAFYRNAEPGFCTPATTNRTNGLVVQWVP